MRAIFFIFILFASMLFSTAQTHWKVSSSFITLKIKNAGLNVDGSIGGLNANIQFDSNNYTKSSIEASIDINTINTGIDLRDKHLKIKEEYFNASKYPKISIKSTVFYKEKDGTYKGIFKLTMKGITKEVAIPFSYTESANTATFKASFTLNRRDYNVGGSSWTMSDNVAISILINATK